MNSPTSFLMVYVLFASIPTVITLFWGGLRSAIRRAELSPRAQRRSFSAVPLCS